MDRVLVGIAFALVALVGAAPLGAGDHIEPLGEQCPLGPGVHKLPDGEAVTAWLPSAGAASCEFMFAPRPGADFVQIDLTDLHSDFDLYAKRNAVPTTTSWDCRPFRPGPAPETCTFAVVGPDTYGIMVRSFSGTGPFTITASSISSPAP